MSNIVFTDDALRSAAAEVREVMLRALPPPSECTHEFSGGFKSKMETLIRRMELRDGLRRLGRSAAAVFLALIVSLSGWLAVDAEARAGFVNWAREVYESSIIYRYFGNEKSLTELPEVELGWLPEGYVEVIRDADEESCVIVYANEADPELGFIVSLHLMTDGRTLELLPKGEYAVKTVEVNGIQGELYIPEDEGESSDLILMDESKGLLITIGATLEESVILHIAKNLNLTY